MSGGRSSAALTTSLEELSGRGRSTTLLKSGAVNKLLLLNNLGVQLPPDSRQTLNKSDSIKMNMVVTTGEIMPSLGVYGVPASVNTIRVQSHQH